MGNSLHEDSGVYMFMSDLSFLSMTRMKKHENFQKPLV